MTKHVFGFSAVTQKIKDSISSVADEVISHSRFRDAYHRLAEAVQYEPEDSIVAVVGPTGAGKTALARFAAAEIDSHYKSIGPEKGQVPTIVLEAESPESHRFQMRPLYMDWLAALNEPLLAQKTDLDMHLQYLRDNGVPLRVADPAQQPLGLLRKLVIRGLAARNNVVTFIDEAQHFAKVSASGLVHQMDLLKSITNQTTRTRLVLLGTGEMLELLDQSAQLSRRVVVVELEPYRASISDLIEFGKGISGLLEKGPVPHQINLKREIAYLRAESKGLFGVAANWVRRGWARALSRGDSHLTIDHLKSVPFNSRTLERIQGEIDRCDMFFRGNVKLSGNAPPETSKSGVRKPGKRKLGRDPVGSPKKAA